MMARYRHAALLPYHAGRITTYMLLGIVAAFLSRQLLADALHQWISAFLLVAAGSMFLLTSLSGLTGKATRMTAGWWERWGNLLAHSARPFFVHPVGVRGYGLGMLLGLIPCGLIFAALMAVSATGDAISGALGMLVFGLGTVPALLIVGLGSQYATARWPGPVRKLIHGLMALNGISLMAIAGRLVW
jgi:sulfite exporter TauE/SafE